MPLIIFSKVSQVTGGNLIVHHDLLSASVDHEAADSQTYFLDVYGLDIMETAWKMEFHNFQYFYDRCLSLTANITVDASNLFIHI